LCGANLYGADLRGANLCGADLRGANLYGANLYGADLENEKLAIAPIQIGGLHWEIIISESYMRIGCQRHTHEEWTGFEDTDIAQMASDAHWFWNENKEWLLAACASHKAKSLQYREDHPEEAAEK
ncbi:Pentapeptide repeat-containing protein, partial [Methylobacillus rhizosphaerae]